MFRWINLRKAFSNYYRQGGNRTRERAPGLQNMLAKLDLTFQVQLWVYIFFQGTVNAFLGTQE